MITIKSLYKSFGKIPVLQGIDLEFSRTGAITAILGPNGSGKTTLIKCLLGMVIPDAGDMELDGQPISGQWRYREQIDYLPQIARFPENLRVREVIGLIRNLRGPGERSEELIGLFGLEPFLDKRLGTLSGGTKQKVNLTLAFMYDSPLLILDEPTSGLDPVALIRLKDFLRREKARGKMILVTTHIMSFVEEMADEIVFLLEGRIYFRGTQQQLRARYGEPNLERAIARILLGEDKVQMNGQRRILLEIASRFQGEAGVAGPQSTVFSRQSATTGYHDNGKPLRSQDFDSQG